MRSMTIVKAKADNEAGVMPPVSLRAEMGAFDEELARRSDRMAAPLPQADTARQRLQNRSAAVLRGPRVRAQQ
jgi:hypothetical protein